MPYSGACSVVKSSAARPSICALSRKQDVLGHQHDLPALLVQPLAHAQDAVVLHAVGQAFRQGDVHAVGLDAQPPPAFQRHALQQVAAAAVPLERADGRAGVRAALALGFFQTVQLLEHRERQHEVVILKAVQRIGRLDQHVGVQYIGFRIGSLPFPAESAKPDPLAGVWLMICLLSVRLPA